MYLMGVLEGAQTILPLGSVAAGGFQTLAILLTGITTIYRPSTYYQLEIFDQLDAWEISDADWHAATTGNVLGALPPP